MVCEQKNWQLYYDAMSSEEYLKVLQEAEVEEAKKQKELK